MTMMMAILAMMTMMVVVVLTALLVVGSDLLGSLRFLELKRKLARLLQAHVRAQFDLRVTRI